MLLTNLQIVPSAIVIDFECSPQQACRLPNTLLDYPWPLRKQNTRNVKCVWTLSIVWYLNSCYCGLFLFFSLLNWKKTNLRNVWYELESWVSKGVISINKFVQQGIVFQRSFNHVIKCQCIFGSTWKLIFDSVLLTIWILITGKMKTNKLKPTHLYINHKEKFVSTSCCIFLNEQNQ